MNVNTSKLLILIKLVIHLHYSNEPDRVGHLSIWAHPIDLTISHFAF